MKYQNLMQRGQVHNFNMRNLLRPESTRAQTRQTGQFVRSTPGSQSLERGLRLLRAFVTGATGLTNADLAERCSLPRPTVSRLTRSLVDGGFLEFDADRSVYRLAPVCLSLGASYVQDHSKLLSVLPLLQSTARQESANVSLAVRDGVHVVYVASFREDRGPIQRIVNPGSRAPIENYASGHALIAAMPSGTRQPLLNQLARVNGSAWSKLNKRIQQSTSQFRRVGYCTLDSVEGLVVVATALHTPDGTLCALVMTAQDIHGLGGVPADFPKKLLALAKDVEHAWKSA